MNKRELEKRNRKAASRNRLSRLRKKLAAVPPEKEPEPSDSTEIHQPMIVRLPCMQQLQTNSKKAAGVKENKETSLGQGWKTYKKITG